MILYKKSRNWPYNILFCIYIRRKYTFPNTKKKLCYIVMYRVVEGFINCKYLHLFIHSTYELRYIYIQQNKNSKLPVSCSIKNCLPSEATTDHCWHAAHTTRSHSAFAIFIGSLMSPLGKLVQSNQSTLVSMKP